jgi:hypothetical protein
MVVCRFNAKAPGLGAADAATKKTTTDGLIAILHCLEPGMSFQGARHPQTKHLEVKLQARKCSPLYFYFDLSVRSAIRAFIILVATGRAGGRKLSRPSGTCDGWASCPALKRRANSNGPFGASISQDAISGCAFSAPPVTLAPWKSPNPSNAPIAGNASI